MTDAPRTTLTVTVTGADRPGVTSALLAAAGTAGAEVLDLQQIVVAGRLTLALVLAPAGPTEELRATTTRAAAELGLEVETTEDLDAPGTGPLPRSGRAAVVVLGTPLHASALAAVAERIAAHGASVDRIRRLSAHPVTAVELDVSGADVLPLRRDLSLVAAVQGVDVAVAPGGLERRGRRLVVMDVDSTFIRQEVIEMLAAHAGREAEVAAVTARAMAGELDFEQSLRERVRALEGLPASVLDEVRARVTLTPGARTLVRTLKRLGFTVALVSGGFIEVVGPLAAQLGIDHARANRLEIADGHLTGKVVGEVVDRAGKERALREFAAAEGLPISRTVAIGDGANDLDMIAAAGLGIAFNAKPVVREQADASVTVPHLDAVLHLLGISRDEIDEADAAASGHGPARTP